MVELPVGEEVFRGGTGGGTFFFITELFSLEPVLLGREGEAGGSCL